MTELGIITVELFLLLFIWLGFAVLLSFDVVDSKVHILPWWRTLVGRQLIAIAVVGIIEAVSLLLAATGHRPPLWVYVIAFGAIDLVTAHWLYLMYKARKKEK